MSKWDFRLVMALLFTALTSMLLSAQVMLEWLCTLEKHPYFGLIIVTGLFVAAGSFVLIHEILRTNELEAANGR